MKQSVDPCLGREWELHQLHSLLSYAESQNCTKTIYIYGITGSGKTHLLNHFIDCVKSAGKRNLAFSQPHNCPAHKLKFSIFNFIKQLLQIESTATDMVITKKVNLVASSSLSYLRTLQLLGFSLSKNQRNTLAKQTLQQMNKIDQQIAYDLIDYAVHKRIALITIDDVHHLTYTQIQFLRLFIEIEYAQPILFILIAQPKDLLTSPPDWLSLAHTMPLKQLSLDAQTRLAKHCLAKKGFAIAKYQTEVKVAIERAAGNPAFLQQLLLTPDYQSFQSTKLQQFIDNTLADMPVELTELFQYAALQGFHFSASQLTQFTHKKHIHAPLCLAQKMLSSGLVVRESDHYSFSHPLIWEGIKNHQPLLIKNSVK
ncbi:ATP-binding protein [Pseudoalteromonas sp. NEC-BIFX-2020_002]|uniref:ATP-binding protein n=1 Tax=Pseudoalteromonas neustonica TaxID=1840331 RepID=A0ABU9U887_9GAMM|nr:ATP-binding protein [Pseudoalteromonas sp. NEC-BIFX-2020_002]NNG44940.1 ATP-binding protein [Pseudoalteromonas sp. NEC-BIFX-2020_002]